jgi:hypothetical protein
MNSLERAAKALMDDLVNDPDSANLAIIAKHLDAFAREKLKVERQAAISIAAQCLSTGCLPAGVQGNVEAVKIVCAKLAQLKEQNPRNGSWIDKWGACVCCDGEIPHGHSNNCDIYKMELEIKALKEQNREFALRRQRKS